jgi:hypothetical protein
VTITRTSASQQAAACKTVEVKGNWSKVIDVTTVRRAELADSETSMTAANDLAVRRALEMAGVEFIDENGGGPGVRLRKPPQGKQRK